MLFYQGQESTVQIILKQSLKTGCLPEDWRDANISPIFKRGDRQQTQNYRPISLTSISCKILEHIIVKHILNHFDLHKIFNKFLERTNDFLSSLDAKEQVDVTIMDFSEVFDTVPHRRLLAKLNYLGII